MVLSHGWPLNADSWESQAFHLSSNGFRVVTHDGRGHGRSAPHGLADTHKHRLNADLLEFAKS